MIPVGMSTAASNRFRRWLQPERAWKGSSALVPVETCYRILDVFLWFSGVIGVVGLTMAYVRGPELMGANPLFWLVCGLQGPVLLSAVFRGWPFAVRHGALAVALFLYSAAASAVVGLAPNTAFFVIILVTTSSLFYGVRVGLAIVLGVLLVDIFLAWGWVTGRLPAFMPDAASTRRYMDFTVASVWIRVLVVGSGLQAGLVLLMRFVLRDLNGALRQSNRMLHKLAEEQEHRARAEEARMKAELAAREAQKFEALGRLASGVAHDFNNLLCVMKCWSCYVEEETKDGATQEAMREIKRAVDNATHLTGNLLAFSRSDASRLEVVDLAAVVQAESRTLARLLPKDVTVSTNSGPAVHVRMGSGQLQEIILNLAVNARDAMPRGGRLDLVVGTTELDGSTAGLPAGRYARLEATDTGEGMDAATQAHIFEPFFTTKTDGRGTGLGLAMVYGLVTGAGGSIRVHSQPGQGTRFVILLPAVAAEEIFTEAPVTRIIAPTRCRVLVVEDQPEILALVELILAREGFPVVAAPNGDEAVAALAGPAGKFGLCLVAGIVPGEPTGRVIERAQMANADCQVIIMSTSTQDQALLRGIQTGLYTHLPKPFDAGQLRQAVNEALGRSAVVPVSG